MKIAIIGAGFTGLSAAWDIAKLGHQVTIFEKEKIPGGLAAGFKEKGWQWSLEKHYHHIFTSDKDVISFAKDLDLIDLLEIHQTKTSTLYQGQIWRLDSALSLLKFKKLPIIDRLRMGVVLACLMIWPLGEYLDRWTAEVFLKRTMGEKSWQVVWKPLFVGKFGKYSSKVNMSWFWARVVSRTKNLGYFKGGFLNFANQIVEKLKEKKIAIKFNVEINEIKKTDGGYSINGTTFDKVVVTGPAGLLSKLAPWLPKKYLKNILDLKSLAAQTLILQLTKEFFSDGTYWLNINENDWPFLAVVEHTAMAGISNYDSNHLLYVAKYLEKNDADFSLNDKELIKKYLPYLKNLNPNIDKLIRKSWLSKAAFAQPIVFTNHSQHLPSFITPAKNLLWASMQHVYPWDRGVNYAVRLGKQIAKQI